MARNQPGLPISGSPPVDDLSAIRGIGPVLARRLHQAGISTYGQLASLSPDELVAKVGGLSARQVTRQGWASQARKLAAKRPASRSRPKEVARQVIRQHYENFTIELLLDEKKRPHRTRLNHIQSGDTKTWNGWEPDQLTDFIARHAGAHVPPTRPEPSVHPPTRNKLSKRAVDKCEENKEIGQPSPPSKVAEMAPVQNRVSAPVHPAQAKIDLTGILSLEDLSILPMDSDAPADSLHQDQPFRVRLVIDLRNVILPGNAPLRYKAAIHCKQLGGTSHLVGEESGDIKPCERATLNVACASLPVGLYRPEALVKLSAGKTTIGLMASRKGELIQIY